MDLYLTMSRMMSVSAMGEELREKSGCCRSVAIPFRGFLLSYPFKALLVVASSASCSTE